jgi:plasmid maintenance system antidote protein VapI
MAVSDLSLELAQWAFQWQLDRTEEARAERNEMLRQALRDEGWTQAEVARATGLSRARVGQIALGD